MKTRLLRRLRAGQIPVEYYSKFSLNRLRAIESSWDEITKSYLYKLFKYLSKWHI